MDRIEKLFDCLIIQMKKGLIIYNKDLLYLRNENRAITYDQLKL